MAHGFIGLPRGNRAYANYLTVNGVGIAPAAYDYDDSLALHAAVKGVESSLKTVRPYNNQYTRLLNQGGYDSTLGDVDLDTLINMDLTKPSPAVKPPSSATSWMDVAKTFVGSVGTGVAQLISGKPPAPSTVIYQQPAQQTASWLMPALAIGGVALLYTVLKRKGKR